MTVNPEIALSFFAEEYRQNHRVTIPNFLDGDFALKLSQNIKDLPDHDWMVSIHPYLPNMYNFHNVEQNRQSILEGGISARSANEKGQFSYLFHRHELHNDTCDCLSCSGIKLMKSEQTMELIKKLTGEEITTAISTFTSCYKADNFLSTHTDTGRGKIAFVLNLTSDWNPDHGGQLQFLDWDFRTVTHTVNPTFNSLTIFRVTDQGVPHRVLRVSNEAVDSRIAISGWFV